MANVKMADIANELGTSVVTVSNALNGRKGVSEELRTRILETALRMGYQGIRVSEQQREKAIRGNIGIVVADRYWVDNSFYPNLYRSLLKAFSSYEYSCMMEIVTVSAEENREIPYFVKENKVDAIVFMGEISCDYIMQLTNFGLPYLLLDFYEDSIDASTILSDNVRGGFILTDHLIKKGHKQIAFVGSVLATTSIMDRYLGYTKALLKAGIQPDKALRLEDRDDLGTLIPIHLPDPLPDAFVCSCDEVAYSMVRLLSEKGYRVPEDAAVVGYDDYRYAMISEPHLTSYHVDTVGMAAAAAGAIHRILSGKKLAAPQTIVTGELVVRDST